jgi:adenosylcobinamide-phosphate synthase
MWLHNPSQILAAITIDLVIGDPRGWPHIARCAGALSTVYESCLTRYFPRSILLGLLFWLLVVGTMVAGYLVVHLICSLVSPMATYLFDIFVIYQAVAAKDLHKHAKTVMQALLSGDLRAARTRLSYIVGRDTRDLDAPEISRATIESVAESLVDGIVAPLFWAIIGGASGALIYRTANTLDSMVGHRTPAYEKFGKATARIDDLLNWVPARLCALMICLFRVPASWPRVRREAAAHASPNAGWPEAAMAYALGVRLGGTNFYDGVPVQGPIFNLSGRAAAISDIRSSLTQIWWVLLAAGGVLIGLSSVPEGLAMVAWHEVPGKTTTMIRPGGNGLINGIRVRPPANTNSAPLPINHTVPYGTGSLMLRSQAFHAWLPSYSPSGTIHFYPYFDSRAHSRGAISVTTQYADTPALQYSAGLDSRTRTKHLAMATVTLS